MVSPIRRGKAHKARNHRADARYTINKYWNGRLTEGKALYFIDRDMFQQGHDYIGSPPWPSLVSLDAFYKDYLLHGDAMPLRRLEFAGLFRAIVGLPAGKARRKPARAEDGTKLYDKNCVFYDISHLRPRSARDGVGTPESP